MNGAGGGFREVVRGSAAVELVDADVEHDGVTVGSLSLRNIMQLTEYKTVCC